MAYKCPICLNGTSELRWNNIHNATELHCRRCERGTIVLSDDAREVH